MLNWVKKLHKTYHNPPLMAESREDGFDACVTIGCQDGLSKIFEMLCSPDDTILLDDPCYAGTLAMVGQMDPNSQCFCLIVLSLSSNCSTFMFSDIQFSIFFIEIFTIFPFFLAVCKNVATERKNYSFSQVISLISFSVRDVDALMRSRRLKQAIVKLQIFCPSFTGNFVSSVWCCANSLFNRPFDNSF